MGMTDKGWEHELAVVDRTMKAISGIVDPEELVSVYWDNVGELLPQFDYISMSRRGVQPPNYLVTRSSRFTEEINPWTQRERLPMLSGGLLGEIAYANKPVIIDDLPARLRPDDPGYFYLQGFEKLFAVPQYDNGEGINSTAMLMPKGKEIDRRMLPMIHWQTGLFGRGTQNLVLRNDLKKVLKSLDRELQAVGDIQRSLLPQTLPDIPGFELAASYRTSARCGGDYYDFFPLNGATDKSGNGWGLFIADVSGHGTPAAVLMAITHALAHAKPGTHTPPGEMLRHLNAQLTSLYTRGGTFVTAFYSVLDPSKRTLTYSLAGHNPPRLVRQGQIIPLGERSSLPMGIERDQPFAETTIQLERGDLLLMYTDGITEAMASKTADGRRELFGIERLDALLRECETGVSATECIRSVKRAVDTFADDALPTDDQTLIAMRCV
jgi:phosphoserine phosphatase RsbU/P